MADETLNVTGISAIVGKAATDDSFRKRLVADPEGVGKEFGLSQLQIDKLKKVNMENLSASLADLKTNLLGPAEGHSSVGHSSVTDSLLDAKINQAKRNVRTR